MSKNALIVQGGWDGHEPELVSRIMQELLGELGVRAEISDTLDSYSDPERLKALRVIVPVWTMGEIRGEYVRNVMAAVESGVGMAGCHGGMCDAFRNSTDWQFLTGSQWVAHPGNDGTEYTVNLRKNASSPILEGMEDFAVKSEQYYIHVDPAVNVLATTRFPVADGPHAANGQVDVPVAYTKLWGKGRVFYSSLGHLANVFDVPEVRRLMKNGLRWAARLD